MKYIKILIIILLSITSFSAISQGLTQSVRGRIVEKNTLEPIPGANVIININGSTVGASTNTNGEFKIEKVPIGRYSLAATMIGYTPFVASNILVNSGKETLLDIAMEESINELDEVVVTAKVDKDQPLNKLATVSARMLSSEEANRYAGSWGDPARMAANFAGVVAANDTRNDIIIRGNSPMGLLWKLDGFEIPNPNHFGSMGGTGGPISMLNNNQLANSDFYTGAFPAEFGNATSGVFDLRLRNGNSQKHEFMASAGFNGFELGAEGPLSKKTGASYLINARYSFLKALDLIGFKVAAAEGAVPEYQDVSAKVNVPLKNGNLSVVTLIGASKIHITPDMSDDSEWAVGDQGTDVKSSSQQYFVGANYTLRLSPSTRIENRLSYQYISSKALQYNVSYPDESKSLYFDGVSSEGRVSYAPTLHHRINPKNFLVVGAGVDVFMTGLNNILYEDSIPQIVQDADKNSALVKGFVQWQHKFSDVLSITPGVYAQYYGLNNDWSVEPRLGLKWTVTNRSSINVGAGLYSQLQPRQVYFYQDSMGVLVNKDLKLSKSWQTVVGYDLKLTKNMRMKVEAYYQYLFDVAVTPEIPEQSMINLGDGFYNNWDYILENKGTGRNYGVELTLEKFFSNQYYFLVTASLYSSKYKGYDGVERNTKFAGNFTINTIAGYEWKLGKSNLLSVNLKGSLLGGNRFLPSTIQNVGDTDPTYDYAHAYEERLPNYFRIDLNINMKSNFKRFALEWFFELDNITNHKNIWYKTYNVNKQEYDYTYQTGFMPMGGCRVYF